MNNIPFLLVVGQDGDACYGDYNCMGTRDNAVCVDGTCRKGKPCGNKHSTKMTIAIVFQIITILKAKEAMLCHSLLVLVNEFLSFSIY